MKERPIIFSGPMVRAILAGTKTQTRRVLKPVKVPGLGLVPAGNFADSPGEFMRYCPYGQPGDRLWVRETWAHGYECGHFNHIHDNDYIYAADRNCIADRWRPSIHMPRIVSRLTLELTQVRVQRVQEIGMADALAEGIDPPDRASAEQIRSTFWRLWDSINGRRAGCDWISNPWVWCLTFKRSE